MYDLEDLDHHKFQFPCVFPKQKIGGIETSRMTRDILYIIGESGELKRGRVEPLESGGGNIICSVHIV